MIFFTMQLQSDGDRQAAKSSREEENKYMLERRIYPDRSYSKYNKEEEKTKRNANESSNQN